MDTETTTKHTGPLRCTQCGGTAGPLDLRTGRCDDCTDGASQ